MGLRYSQVADPHCKRPAWETAQHRLSNCGDSMPLASYSGWHAVVYSTWDGGGFSVVWEKVKSWPTNKYLSPWQLVLWVLPCSAHTSGPSESPFPWQVLARFGYQFLAVQQACVPLPFEKDSTSRCWFDGSIVADIMKPLGYPPNVKQKNACILPSQPATYKNAQCQGRISTVHRGAMKLQRGGSN